MEIYAVIHIPWFIESKSPIGTTPLPEQLLTYYKLRHQVKK